MRKYAALKKPIRCNGGEIIYKIMLHTTKDGIYLYKYGWIEAADPAEGEQHDAFPAGHASAARK